MNTDNTALSCATKVEQISNDTGLGHHTYIVLEAYESVSAVLSPDSGLPSIFLGGRGKLCGDASRDSGRCGVCVVGVCCTWTPLRRERAEGLKYPHLGQTYSIQ